MKTEIIFLFFGLSRCTPRSQVSSRNVEMKTIIGDFELNIVLRYLMNSGGILHQATKKNLNMLATNYSQEYLVAIAVHAL